jgi:hypothetical protein
MEPERTTERKKRPTGVWVIFIFYLFAFLYTSLSYYLVYSGKIPPSPALKAYLSQLTWVDTALSLLTGVFNLAAAFLLFQLRSIALKLFVISFAANVLITLYHIANKGFLAALPSGGFFGLLLGWGMLLAICLYAWRLEKNGIVN